MILNVNVGILGHVDSGKTSLSKALSTVASTAAFDKNPQSQRRGITLDLGFSSFSVSGANIPAHLLLPEAPLESLQVTLVDCPGHASLIRTIICGCHIIDLMLLVVDINKGFQTQTAECLIIGELSCDALVVVLNKVDLIEPEKRSDKISKMKTRILKTLENTSFKNSAIATVAAAPSGNYQSADGSLHPEGISELISLLLNAIPDPRTKRAKQSKLPFLFAVDHCFAKTGKGTVLTGTVLRGSAIVNDIVEIPQMRLQNKIKSMEMFRKPVTSISPGDRVGICISKLDPNVMERGYLAKLGSLVSSWACLIGGVKRISYFKYPITSRARFHVSVGQDTVVARITCFHSMNSPRPDSGDNLDLESQEFEYLEQLPEAGLESPTFILLVFDAPVVIPTGGLVIGSRLDTDLLASTCRLAFHGVVLRTFPGPDFICPLSVYRQKSRQGDVERVTDTRTCIVRGLFKRETNWEIFQGLKVTLSSKEVIEEVGEIRIPGIIEGSFGQSGKCRVRLHDDLPEYFLKNTSSKGAKKADFSSLFVSLDFKKNIFDSKKKFIQ